MRVSPHRRIQELGDSFRESSRSRIFFAIVTLLVLVGLIVLLNHVMIPLNFTQTGVASWYGPNFAGRTTASGEVFDPAAFTAAHRTLPLGSIVEVTRLANDARVVVRINDRGPYVGGRIIDLSHTAARAIGITGTGRVRIDGIRKPALGWGCTLLPAGGIDISH